MALVVILPLNTKSALRLGSENQTCHLGQYSPHNSRAFMFLEYLRRAGPSLQTLHHVGRKGWSPLVQKSLRSLILQSSADTLTTPQDS